MKKIVVLYPELLNLYGEYAAPLFMSRRLSDAGIGNEIVKCPVGEKPDFGGCDMLYIPAGTEKSALRALDEITAYKDELLSYLSDGTALISGCSVIALVSELTSASGERREGLGFFETTASLAQKRYYSEFIMQSDRIPGEVVGCINTSMAIGRAGEPMFRSRFDSQKLLSDGTEGFVLGNVFATQLTGPLVVRNPHVLDYFCSLIAGEQLASSDELWYSYAQKGCESVLAALQKESGGANA